MNKLNPNDSAQGSTAAASGFSANNNNNSNKYTNNNANLTVYTKSNNLNSVSSSPSPLSSASSSSALPKDGNATLNQQSSLISSSNGSVLNNPSESDFGRASSMTDSASVGVSMGTNTGGGSSTTEKKKIGHREVKHGVVLYKKVSTDELKKAIQFGIVHFIHEQNRHSMDRDLIMQDFQAVETIVFPKAGSLSTPPHNFNDFKLKVYAAYGFRYLRRKFNVNEVDFMHALGETDLKEIQNPGASGSVFYKTSNDKYLLKTVQYQECEFLKTLLAGYTLNVLQNLIEGKFTLLPTIYGLFCYQKSELTSMLSDKTNIRIVIMNNILPSDVPIHEKYDLKGSTYNRKASKQELSKSSPTYKDLDFLRKHPDGLVLDEKHYDNIISSLKRDCLILQSFGIMDYSLLIGIHNLEQERVNTAIEAYYDAKVGDVLPGTTSTNQNIATSSMSNANDSIQPSTSSANASISSPHKSSIMSSSNKNWDNVFNV